MNVMVSFLMEVGSHMQLRNRTEFRLIASIQDVLSVQETHDTDLSSESRGIEEVKCQVVTENGVTITL